MDTFNSTLTQLTDLLLAPLSPWPLLALLFYSVITGILLAIVFRFTSNQRAIRHAADGCRAEVLAIKLFQDDLGGIIRSLGKLLRHAAARLWHSLPPALVVLLPFVLILVQLAQRYDRRPLLARESAIVHLRLDEERWDQTQHAEIKLPDCVTLQAGPLRDANEHAVYWRIEVAESPSSPDSPQLLQWKIGDEVTDKHLATASDRRRLQLAGARRAGLGWLDQVLHHPCEPGLPREGSVRGIVVGYPNRCTRIFGWDIPWWATFLVASMVSAFLVRPLVGVEF